jgi:hypothetical protein
MKKFDITLKVFRRKKEKYDFQCQRYKNKTFFWDNKSQKQSRHMTLVADVKKTYIYLSYWFTFHSVFLPMQIFVINFLHVYISSFILYMKQPIVTHGMCQSDWTKIQVQKKEENFKKQKATIWDSTQIFRLWISLIYKMKTNEQTTLHTHLVK